MYFVTVCARNMECVFGSVGSNGKVTLSEWGHVVEACWLAIPEHSPGSALDQWVTMPNHLHGIVTTEALTGNARATGALLVRARHASPLRTLLSAPGAVCLRPAFARLLRHLPVRLTNLVEILFFQFLEIE